MEGQTPPRRFLSGVDICMQLNSTIQHSIIQTGDDCISIGPGSMNMWIQKIGCGPGHGISIGSLANSLNEAGVQNITVANSVFTKTQNGVRVKSWARPSDGYARTLMFRNLVMKILAILSWLIKLCPDNSCPHQNSGVKVVETGIQYKGTSSTQKQPN
ncbi:hypothetical protein HAX54_024140 [Datura stramonium]|uniref:Polygalacturonase n=1 Tax=Datura stramonium TaxID=4076 RepID=A0ABS8S5A7_DATST|nr:hypothetical protein [Datura stramonium]